MSIILPQWIFFPIGFFVAILCVLYYRGKVVESVYIDHTKEIDAIAALICLLIGIFIAVYGIFPYLPAIIIAR